MVWGWASVEVLTVWNCSRTLLTIYGNNVIGALMLTSEGVEPVAALVYVYNHRLKTNP